MSTQIRGVSVGYANDIVIIIIDICAGFLYYMCRESVDW